MSLSKFLIESNILAGKDSVNVHESAYAFLMKALASSTSYKLPLNIRDDLTGVISI